MKNRTDLLLVRTVLLCVLPLLLNVRAATAQETFKLQNAATKYDVVVNVAACGGENQHNLPSLCGGAGRVSLYRKGARRPFQVLRLREILIDKDHIAYNPKISEKPRALYEEAYGVVFEDFNFDGEEDLAVWSGTEGGYGGPSYNVYLFNKRSNKFIENERLSELTEGYLGLFFVAPKEKRLIAFSKSGCCYHETEKYKMVNDRPILMEKIIDDATHESGAPEGFVLVTTKRRVGGRWVVRKRKEKIEEDNE